MKTQRGKSSSLRKKNLIQCQKNCKKAKREENSPSHWKIFCVWGQEKIK